SSDLLTTIISPNPASKDWREPCGRPSPSTSRPQTKFRQPRGPWAGDPVVRLRSGPARLICGFEAFSSVRETSKMSIYTVHAPPAKSGQSAPDPERFVFVRDGFSFWAFLLGPLWMVWHGLWLATVGYLVLAAALQFVLGAAGAQSGLALAAGAFLALLVGFEAATLRRPGHCPGPQDEWRGLGVG